MSNSSLLSQQHSLSPEKQAQEAASPVESAPAICRKCYVHPEIIDAYLNGSLLKAERRRQEKIRQQSLNGLRPEELSVLALLEQ
jgi:DNA topoisomerase I